MSIVGLASAKVARRSLPSLQAKDIGSDNRAVTDALSAIAAYVPTEILTAYTLALAVAGKDKVAGASSGAQPIGIGWYVGFLAVTPVFVWLVFAARSKELNVEFLSWRMWPWWEAAAACVAFTSWSAAMPQSAFARFAWYSPGVAAVVLMLTSGLLPLFGVLVTKSRT